ncbi:hypothetical protein ACKVMT_09415 [Halobacteriales archaeon Cl-PHB]
MHRLARESLRLTVALLVASAALIGPSLLGVGGSPLLAGVLLLVAGTLYAVREDLAAVDPVWLYQPGPHLAVLWTGPLLAVTVVVLFGLGASAGELQALGGLCGLAGMLNYFLRPVYALVASLLGLVNRAAS